MAQLNFNASTVAPNQAFEVIPAGWYNVRITESSTKPTNDGKGSYLALTLSVIDGQFANRKLFDRLNLNNANPKAVEIAYQTLSAICHATSVIQVQDSSQLHGVPMQAKVKIRPAEGKYEESNEISGYRKIEGATNVPAFVQQPPAQPSPTWTPPAPQAPVVQPAQQAAGGAVPPWAK